MSAGILVGTDFSDGSTLALAEARRLAGAMGVVVQVAHVAESARGGPDPGAEGWLDQVELPADSVVFRKGVPAVELARLARELEVAMIVLGTHGATGYQPMALGATAARLALLAPCPVVLVGPRGRSKGGAAKRNQRNTGQVEGRPSRPTGPAVSGERS